MVWHINGTDAAIGLHDGVPYVSGSGRQSPSLITEASAELMFQLMDVDAGWVMYPHTIAEVHLDAAGKGFKKRVESAPSANHFMINYYPANGSTRKIVEFTICLPETAFQTCLTLWREFVFGAAALRYRIVLDYLGFRSPGAATDNATPAEWTAREFTDRKAAFGTGFDMHFHPRSES